MSKVNHPITFFLLGSNKIKISHQQGWTLPALHHLVEFLI
jgi:hypothetical protein